MSNKLDRKNETYKGDITIEKRIEEELIAGQQDKLQAEMH